MVKYDHRTFPSEVSNGHFRYIQINLHYFLGSRSIFDYANEKKTESLVTSDTHISDLRSSRHQIILLFISFFDKKNFLS